MKIRCPKCDMIHDLEDVKVGRKVECVCSNKFVIDEQHITLANDSSDSDGETLSGTMFSFEGNEYDFSRCICKSCGKRLNIEDLSPGERFECPFCKTANIVGQNGSDDIEKNSRTTSATITDGGHAYAEDKNVDGSIPEIIGGCRIEKILGEGGMGRVYLARHGNLDILVALKTMLSGFGTINTFSERFFREARTAAKINHPNVVRVYDCGNENGTLFIVMEYVSGGSAGDLLKEEGKLSTEVVLQIAENMCQALVEAQKFGIIHRDIKPDNIMRSEEGVFKLADLGLAKQITPDKVDVSLTMEATGMGTPLYMPPEQSIDAKSCDIRSDIYALGATLYHLVCGKAPFLSNSQITLFKMHSEDIPESPSIVNPEIPEGFSKIIGKCMGKTLDARYQDPRDMLEDLKRLRDGKDIPSFSPLNQSTVEEREMKSQAHSDNFFSLPLIISLISLFFIIFSLTAFFAWRAFSTTETDQEASVPEIVESGGVPNSVPNDNTGELVSVEISSSTVAEDIPPVSVSKDNNRVTELPLSLREKLVLFYNFNNPEDDKKVLDLSGNFYVGTILGPERVEVTGFGKVLRFDGKNDYVNCGSPAVMAKGSITLSVWMKTNQSLPTQRWIMSRSKWGEGAWQLTTHKGKVGVEFGPGGQLLGKTIVADGEWHHLVGCYNSENNERRLYIDGELEVFTKDKPAFVEKSGDILIGVRDGANDFFEGMIDNVMIYHRVLDDDEILQLSKIRIPAVKKYDFPWHVSFFNGHAYKVYDADISWTDAEKKCVEMGGHLADGQSEEELAFLKKLADGKQVWIGASDEDGDGIYKWTDGTSGKLLSDPFKKKLKKGQMQRKYIALSPKGRLTRRINNPNPNHLKNKIRINGFICEWDNPPPDNKFKLIVQTKTSFRRNSGTKAPVYVLINGDENLKRRIPKALKSKALQTFEFDYDFPVDQIENIKITIGSSDAWGVSNIAFQVVQGDKKSEMKSVGGGYFSTRREGGGKATRSKTYEFKPALKKGDSSGSSPEKSSKRPSGVIDQEPALPDNFQNVISKLQSSRFERGRLVNSLVAEIREKHKEIILLEKQKELSKLVKLLIDEAGKKKKNQKRALLEVASEILFDSGDFSKAMELCEQIAACSEKITPLQAKIALIVRRKDKITDAKQRESLAELALKLGFETLVLNRFDEVLDIGNTARELLKSCKRLDLEYQAQFLCNEALWLESTYKDFYPYIKRLDVSPGNHTANEKVGLYLCLARNDFKRGIPLLAKSSHIWKAIAKKEQATPEKPSMQVQLADLWWKQASTIKNPEFALRCKQRAKRWYLSAIAASKGKERTKLVKHSLLRIDSLPTQPVTLWIRAEKVEGWQGIQIRNDGISMKNGHGTRAVLVNHLRWDGMPRRKWIFKENSGKDLLFLSAIDFSTADIRRIGEGRWGQISFNATPDCFNLNFGHGPGGSCGFDFLVTFQSRNFKLANRFSGLWDVAWYQWDSKKDKVDTLDGWKKIISREPTDRLKSDNLNFRCDEEPYSSHPCPPSPKLKKLGRRNYYALVARAEYNLPKGNYEIHTLHDDGLRVFIDDKLVLDAWGKSGWPSTAKIAIDKGKHNVRVEYYEAKGGACLTFSLRRILPGESKKKNLQGRFWQKMIEKYTLGIIKSGKGYAEALEYFKKIKESRTGTKYAKIAETEINKLKKAQIDGNLTQKQKDIRVLFDSIAVDIISAKFAAADKKSLEVLEIDPRIHKVVFLEISSQLDLLSHSEELISAMILKQIGKSASCLGARYKEYTIKKVTKSKITIFKDFGKIKTGKTFKIKNLSTQVKSALIAKENKSTAYIYAGICELRKKNYKKAEKYFKKAGPLSEALLKQLSNKKQGLAFKPGGKTQEHPATIYASANDMFNLYLNGKSVMGGKGAHLKKKQVSIKNGDVLTVRATNLGGLKGFACVIILDDDQRYLSTSAGWNAYIPGDEINWYLPENVQNIQKCHNTKPNWPTSLVENATRKSCRQIWGKETGGRAHLSTTINTKLFKETK